MGRMKMRTFASILLLLSLPLSFNFETHAQQKDPQRDLSNLVWLNTVAGRENVEGELTNRSGYLYQCVRMEFNLHASSGQGMLVKGPVTGTVAVELRDVLPNRVRKFSQQLTSNAVHVSRKSITDCSPPPAPQIVTLYDGPNFGGRSRSFAPGKYTLNSVADFNDQASSIRVPNGLVAIVFADADAIGGYGLFVDFMEDQPNLALHNFDKKISHLIVFKSPSNDGGTWVRNNNKETGAFKAGYWQMGRSLAPKYPDPLVGTKPRRIQFCTVSGSVRDDRPNYLTLIKLHLPNGSPTQFSVRAMGGRYTIPNVPEGTYEVRGSGRYPRSTTSS